MQFGHFKLILVLYLATLSLQAKESFKNFHSYKAELNENFKEYKDENDRVFRALLSGEWSSYKATQDELYEQKKPQTTPTKSFEKVVGVGPKVYIDVKEAKELPTQTLSGNIDFFGTKLSINIPVYENAPNLSSYSKNSILSFFDYLAKENIDSTIADIKSTRGEFALNDWAIYLLVEHISSKVFSDERAKLLSWVIFNKLGYSVKAGVAKDKIALLFYSKKSIYATPAYVFGAKKYYFVGATSAPAVSIC